MRKRTHAVVALGIISKCHNITPVTGNGRQDLNRKRALNARQHTCRRRPTRPASIHIARDPSWPRVDPERLQFARARRGHVQKRAAHRLAIHLSHRVRNREVQLLVQIEVHWACEDQSVAHSYCVFSKSRRGTGGFPLRTCYESSPSTTHVSSGEALGWLWPSTALRRISRWEGVSSRSLSEKQS